jgi:hypothetical protein
MVPAGTNEVKPEKALAALPGRDENRWIAL